MTIELTGIELARIVEIVSNPDQDWKAIVLSLASLNPKALLEVQEKTGIYAEVREVAVSQGKVAGIKFYRERTGASLRDAKEFVEQVAGEFV